MPSLDSSDITHIVVNAPNFEAPKRGFTHPITEYPSNGERRGDLSYILRHYAPGRGVAILAKGRPIPVLHRRWLGDCVTEGRLLGEEEGSGKEYGGWRVHGKLPPTPQAIRSAEQRKLNNIIARSQGMLNPSTNQAVELSGQPRTLAASFSLSASVRPPPSASDGTLSGTPDTSLESPDSSTAPIYRHRGVMAPTRRPMTFFTRNSWLNYLEKTPQPAPTAANPSLRQSVPAAAFTRDTDDGSEGDSEVDPFEAPPRRPRNKEPLFLPSSPTPSRSPSPTPRLRSAPLMSFFSQPPSRPPLPTTTKIVKRKRSDLIPIHARRTKAAPAGEGASGAESNAQKDAVVKSEQVEASPTPRKSKDIGTSPTGVKSKEFEASPTPPKSKKMEASPTPVTSTKIVVSLTAATSKKSEGSPTSPKSKKIEGSPTLVKSEKKGNTTKKPGPVHKDPAQDIKHERL